MHFAVILSVRKFLPAFTTLIFLFFLSPVNFVTAQIIISGTVYDSTKLYSVPGVIVKSTGGSSTITDSLGAYHIAADEKDSLMFYYAHKSTQKFPVKSMGNYNEFNISLQVHVFEKYKLLKEIKIFTKNYRQDSAENRLTYSKVFNYEKPRLQSGYTPGSPPGLDINELINIFRFRRNKMNLAFQKRLVLEEEDKYINYRFNAALLKRITGLTGIALEKYKLQYRPSYEFLITTPELEFYEYIINTSNRFKKQEGLK